MTAPAFLFDLDMTLVDSEALASFRLLRDWAEVKKRMGLIGTFELAPHSVPQALKTLGHPIGVVTSSPRWYAEDILARFGIPYDTLVAYGDTTEHKPHPEPLLTALSTLGVAPHDAYYVGDDPVDVETSFNAGVTSIGAGWAIKDLETFSSTAPDLMIQDPTLLLEVGTLETRRYVAEALSEGIVPNLHWGSTVRAGGTPTRYALGRYFATADRRHATSRLSETILSLKNGDGVAPRLGEALGRAVANLDWKPDYIVPVPPKPSQTRNRFEAVLTAANQWIPRVIVVPDGLRCVKETVGYKMLRPAERATAIHGAFESKYTWNNKKVLLVDDVLTTGGTISECAQRLTANAAAEVRVMVLGKDQRTFERRPCPKCGQSLRVKTNRYGEKFWGCRWPSCDFGEDFVP